MAAVTATHAPVWEGGDPTKASRGHSPALGPTSMPGIASPPGFL